ncbi:MAG: SDR family oxidoreductase [Rhodospirillaceae bacterium]|jgi:nucleoside-diphosphate-sugar epimerase|nr:SDR family oxidoreductase [Rhodospirillaceae bacterium]MBT7267734.1 SDR family oxidoreductase [Rhodospirillaceae bacterium]
MSKILITGATGFVGQAVCKKLREGGHMLTGTTRTPDQGAGPERVPLYHIPEIGPDTDWSQAVSGADIVIHLAARVHVMKDRSPDPLADYRNVNTAGTRKLAQQAAAAGVKRFVFISTIKVAGENSPVSGFTEDDHAMPEDPYGVSKWEAEQALADISRSTGLEVVILRPPLVYGPGVKGNFLSLFEAINKNRVLPLGAIQNHRSFLSVFNLADAIATAAEHPNAAGQTFFVADEHAISTPDLVRKIAAALDTKPRLLNFPLGLLKIAGFLTGKSAAVQRVAGSLTVNTRRIQTQLNWHPPVSMEDGLKETAGWFKSKK